MTSRKQEIYCEFLSSGFSFLRAVCWTGASTKPDELDQFHELFREGAETANFLHNVHLSILEPGFVQNDIRFINLAFPVYLGRLGVDGATARLMIEFYDLVPESLRHELSWHPDARLRHLAHTSRPDEDDPSNRGPN